MHTPILINEKDVASEEGGTDLFTFQLPSYFMKIIPISQRVRITIDQTQKVIKVLAKNS